MKEAARSRSRWKVDSCGLEGTFVQSSGFRILASEFWLLPLIGLALPAPRPDLHFAGSSIGPGVIRYRRDPDGFVRGRLICIEVPIL